MSAIRAASTRHLATFPGRTRKFHTVNTTSGTDDTRSLRRVIRVSKLNFGPFDPRTNFPQYSPHGAVAAEATDNLHNLVTSDISCNLVPLCCSVAEAPDVLPLDSSPDSQTEKTLDIATEAFPLDRPFNLQDSWIAQGDIPRGSAVVGLFASNSILEGLEDRLFQSEEWSAISEANETFGSGQDTSSTESDSVNEESYMRIAVAELGW